jgi:MFS family permease
MLTFVWALGAALLGLVASAASQAATVVAVSNVYLDRPASVSDSFSRVKGEILPVIGLSLVMGIAVGFASILLLVPGILLALMWAVAVPAKVLEDKGVFDAMSRSSELTQGSRGRIFVIGLMIFALGLGVGSLLQAPIMIVAGASIFSGKARALGAGWQVASQVGTFISQCLVGPIGTIAFSLVYYDQRVRKEAFDLQLMMSTLDSPTLAGSPQQIGA